MQQNQFEAVYNSTKPCTAQKVHVSNIAPGDVAVVMVHIACWLIYPRAMTGIHFKLRGIIIIHHRPKGVEENTPCSSSFASLAKEFKFKSSV